MWNNQILKKIDLIVECLIYILIVFLFMDKGETLRTISIYIPFSLLIFKSLILKENPIRLNNSILLFIFLCLFCLSGIIASLFSPSLLYSLKWFKKTYLKLSLVGIVFLSFFNSQDKFFRLRNILIISALIFIVFVYYDFYSKVLKYNEDYAKSIRKYISPLEVFLPFTFCLLIEKKKYIKYLGLLIIIFGAASVILTGSRGGWISVFISFSICVYGYLYLKKAKLKKILVAVCCFSLIMFVLFSFFSPSYIQMKFEQLLTGYTSLRADIVWPAAIESYLNLSLINKIFGNGLGRMTYLEDFRKWYLEKFNSEPTELYSPHNLYLSILYKQGILGLTIFLSFISISIIKLIKIIKIIQISINIRFFGICILATLISILIHSFVEDTFREWILIIPLAMAYINYTESILKNVGIDLSCSRRVS